jgi:hypothetical protein
MSVASPSTAPEYLEPLPSGCPPPEATEVAAEMVVYRLVRTDPATMSDFRSRRESSPNSTFRISECHARGVSVWSASDACRQAKKLPGFRRSLLCRVRLACGAGRVQQTFQPYHWTWWPYRGYDVLPRCEVIP